MLSFKIVFALFAMFSLYIQTALAAALVTSGEPVASTPALPENEISPSDRHDALQLAPVIFSLLDPLFFDGSDSSTHNTCFRQCASGGALMDFVSALMVGDAAVTL
jgi:hypothetical protein